MDFTELDPLFDLPSPSFDTFADPNLFFDFDGYTGLAPEASSPKPQQIPQPTEDAQVDFSSLLEDTSFGNDFTFDSLLDDTLLTIPDERPADVQPPLSLVPPSNPTAAPLENKDACSQDVFDALLAELLAPPGALPGNPTSVDPQDVFPFPSESWPTEEFGSFTWVPTPNFDVGLFTEPQYSDAQTKTDAFAAQANPFFPDLSTVSAGEIPFTFDEEASLVPIFTPIASLTAPQSVVSPSLPTTALQHPRPIAPASPPFIKTESVEEEFGPSNFDGPSSIIDAQGRIKFSPAPSASLSPEPPKRDLTTPVVNGKVIKRIPRPAKAKDVNASDWYSPPPQIPSWGGPSPSNPLFTYNPNGEWSPSQRFSRDEILHYLTERKRLSLPLTLWIQNLPHGCVKRVTDGRTLKCRWDGCPAQNGTILKGFWRVCFDERPETSGKQHNPFHNAGYMHLWCLDRCFDLFEISQAFDLRPDTRHFEKEERNPMAMTRDHDELVMEFENWREEQTKAYETWRAQCEANKALGIPPENRVVEREQKLWYILTTKHLALETVVRQTMRDNRGGISIDQHKGDLGWYIKKVNERKSHTRAQKDAGSRALARLATDCDDVFGDDADVPETPRRGAARSHRAEDGGRTPQLGEIGSRKRQRCVADECAFDGEGERKRQRRHCRSI
ncbi:hypothetical protein CkaCkLH20_09472 [Colletotrichum karsti]|uniref:Uncharacterized protein n=1 Tax=Colletotrichum karsti TaxID=1095194 RepID=A0A9P6HZE1_9PEZI|nr:uncharacterized protein CkaCkLH20_09472 [Colletotrichum karsti]KAF9872962.1 hypothetical protein CkaCkLH20_09472 [Colletotrichum karsti]